MIVCTMRRAARGGGTRREGERAGENDSQRQRERDARGRRSRHVVPVCVCDQDITDIKLMDAASIRYQVDLSRRPARGVNDR